MTIKPLHDNVVIEPAKADKTTKSGILLPDTVDKGNPEQGTVVAIGGGKVLENGTRLAMSVKVGDKVLFKKYSPDSITLDSKDYLMISEADILAIL